MMFQVLYSDSDGHKFATERLNKVQCDNFCKCLQNADILYEIVEREDRKYLACKVFFTDDDVDKEDKLYTFVDESNSSKEGDIVEVRCTDGRIKRATVKEIALKTSDELVEFCKRIKYPKLGRVLKLIWRPRRSVA